MANKKSLMEAFEVEPKVFSSNEDVNDYDVFRNKHNCYYFFAIFCDFLNLR